MGVTKTVTYSNFLRMIKKISQFKAAVKEKAFEKIYISRLILVASNN